MGAPNTVTRSTEGAGECWWCGQRRRVRFGYSVAHGAFCNLECAAAYSGTVLRKGIDYDWVEFT